MEPNQPSLQHTPEATFFGGGSVCGVGINQPGLEASGTEFETSGAQPPLPYALYDVHRDSFTFTLMYSEHKSVDNVLKPAEGLIRLSCWLL